MKKKIIAAVSALLISFSIAIPALAVDTPTTWDDLPEDAQAIGTAYANAFSQYLKGDVIGGSLSFLDVPISYYKFVTDLGWCISPVDDVYYYLVDGELFVDDTNRHSGGGGSHSSGIHGGGGGQRRVSSEDDVVSDKQFYQSLVTKNPSPLTVDGRLSIKSSLFSNSQYNSYVNFYANGTFTHKNLRSVYILPFYYDAANDKYYYGAWQGYYTQLHGEKGDDGLVPITLQVSFNNCLIPNYDYAFDYWSEPHSLYKLSSYPYARINICHAYESTFIRYFANYDSYLTIGSSSYVTYTNAPFTNTKVYDLSDTSFNTTISLYNAYCQVSSSNDNDCGFLFSDSPFIFNTSINYDNISDSVIFYPSGGDIYIDDTADTKQGDTVYNYIYNNYVFNTPDNPTDDSGVEDNTGGGSGGTTSGDITVDGRVEVDGNITISANPIDININVNSGSSGSHGTFEAAPSYIDGKDVELDKYLELAPEMSDGFIDFVRKSLNWLPAEILGLLILGLVIAVWLRIVGR